MKFLRREDNSLADHHAVGGEGDVHSVAARAGRTAHERGIGGRGPATVADVTSVDGARVCVGSLSSKHAESLEGLSSRIHLQVRSLSYSRA